MRAIRKRHLLAYALSAGAVVGCRPSSVEQGPVPATAGVGALMLGSWEVVPAEGRGPMLGFTVDSAAGDRFFGRVTVAFAGDAGQDPATFPPFTGTMGADSVARVTVMQTGYDVPAYDLTVRPRGDTLEVRAYRWGGEDMMATGRGWVGRRGGRSGRSGRRRRSGRRGRSGRD